MDEGTTATLEAEAAVEALEDDAADETDMVDLGDANGGGVTN